MTKFDPHAFPHTGHCLQGVRPLGGRWDGAVHPDLAAGGPHRVSPVHHGDEGHGDSPC